MLAAKIISDARLNPVKVCLKKLLKDHGYDPNDNLLKGVLELTGLFKEYELELIPSIEDNFNDINLPRILQSSKDLNQFKRSVDELIEAGGENERVEIKQSVYIDTQKKKFNPKLELKELYNENLAIKLSQEINAFLNSNGGKILIGVRDSDLKIVGCQDDFDYFERKAPIVDKAGLMVQKIVDKYFLESSLINRYIKVEAGLINKLPLILLIITAADKLAFLKPRGDGKAVLYNRIQDKAQPITIDKLEHYYVITRKL